MGAGVVAGVVVVERAVIAVTSVSQGTLSLSLSSPVTSFGMPPRIGIG
jgi:hypothetical protein